MVFEINCRVRLRRGGCIGVGGVVFVWVLCIGLDNWDGVEGFGFGIRVGLLGFRELGEGLRF